MEEKNRGREEEKRERERERAIREIASVSVKATLAPATRATLDCQRRGERMAEGVVGSVITRISKCV